MLYTYPKFNSHISFRLNRNIIYFFVKLRQVNSNTVLNFNDYFSKDFAKFISNNKQATLRQLFTIFFDTFKVLPQIDRNDVISKFFSAQRIETILDDNTINCTDYLLGNLPISLRVPSRNLFEYLFTTTINSYGKIKEHYKLIFDSIESNICPFCGIELLNNPSIIRQDYDHLMKQSTYVFTSVNMANLAPTGTECNRINKQAIDSVYHNGTRSVFNSPYIRNYNIRISLIGSTPPTTIDGNGNWIINISPNNDYTRQWAYVYNIKTRYTDNVLQKFYKNWLKQLKVYLENRNLTPIDVNTLENELLSESNTLINNPTTSLANVIKGAFFEFLAQHQDIAYKTSIINYINN